MSSGKVSFNKLRGMELQDPQMKEKANKMHFLFYKDLSTKNQKGSMVYEGKAHNWNLWVVALCRDLMRNNHLFLVMNDRETTIEEGTKILERK